MKVKFCIGVGIIGGLLLVGCMNGIYSSSVSVTRDEYGVEDYTIVKSLDTEDIGSSMPIVVEEKSSTDKWMLGGDMSAAMFFLSLGVIPAVETEETVGEVFIKTPIGEKTGIYKIKRERWFGWLGLLPYPVLGDKRIYDYVYIENRLPNYRANVRDKLVANIVSQFSKKEYASYISPEQKEERKKERMLKEEYVAWQKSDDYVVDVEIKVFDEKYRKGWRERAEKKRVLKEEYVAWQKSDDYVAGIEMEVFDEKYRKGWRERAEKKQKARLVKEFEARAEKERLARRADLYNITVTNYLAQIRACYAEDEFFLNPFLGKRRNGPQKTDWLSKWASPRLNISEADELAGQALLFAFGTKYLPNAYANYEKKRDALIEIQQVFNEEFPQPWAIKTTSPKWSSFNKVLEKFAKARTEFFICHDELCHYWLLSRFGVFSDKEFFTIDNKRLAVHLLPENVECARFTFLKADEVEEKISAFAVKYAPELNSIYQNMAYEFKELENLLSEVSKQRLQMDDARYSRVFEAAVSKRNEIVRKMNELLHQFESWHVSYKVAEMSIEDIAKADADMAKKMKPFMDSLLNYIKKRALGPVIADSELVIIPERHYKMQRTEVTQFQWMAVMGNNPSHFLGPDRPVENVSWLDCQKFIKRLSEMDGFAYRMPTGEEWEYACRAGSEADWGKRTNGECGPLDVMGWYGGGSQGSTSSVALKEPNAWGLYDMHGNVCEWSQDESRSTWRTRVYHGGSWMHDARHCTASCRGEARENKNRIMDDGWYRPRYHDGVLGFRLAISQD